MYLNTTHPGSPDFIPTVAHDNSFQHLDAAEAVVDAYDFVQAQLKACRERVLDVMADLPGDPEAVHTFDAYAADLLSDVFGRRIDDAREFVEVADA